MSMKIWRGTHNNLRTLRDLTGESMVSIVDRLVAEELKRIEAEIAEEDSQMNWPAFGAVNDLGFLK